MYYSKNSVYFHVTEQREYYGFSFILLIALCSINFFNPVFLVDINIPKYLYIFLLIISLPNVVREIITNNKYIFSFPVKLIIASMFFAVISAMVFWKQSFFDSFMGMVFPVLGYVFYFYFLRINLNIDVVERVFVWLGGLSILFFFISFLIYPKEIFINPYVNDNFDRGFQRLQLSGFGFIYLFFFYSVTRIINSGGFKWVVLGIIAYICILMSLTRTYIAFSTLIALFYFFKRAKVYVKLFVLVMTVIAFIYISQLEAVQLIVETTNRETENIHDYIRIQAAEYFLGDFQQSTFTRLFGNGFSYRPESYYGKIINDLQNNRGFFIVDLGIVGLYIYLGILALVAYIIIFYRSFSEKLPVRYSYLKMFMTFILFIGFNSYATYNQSFLLAIVFTLYLYEKVQKDKLSRVEY